MSQILLSEKPLHILSKSLSFRGFFIQILGQCFGSCEVLFYWVYVYGKFLMINTEALTNLQQLVLVLTFLYGLYCFLTDVEAHIFVVYTLSHTLRFSQSWLFFHGMVGEGFMKSLFWSHWYFKKRVWLWMRFFDILHSVRCIDPCP